MKSTIKDSSKSEYPKLMKSRHNNTVVFFTSESKGFVVNTQVNEEELGYFSNAWSMREFERFDKPIELSND